MQIHRDGLIAFHQIMGVGWHTIHTFFEIGWSFEKKPSNEMISTLRRQKVTQKVLSQLDEKWTPLFIRRVKEELSRRNIGVITLFDKAYPPLLREIPQPPWVLYYRGDISILQIPLLAMVGTRKPTPYGIKSAQVFSGEVAHEGWGIVSGMALGIDGQAHRSVIKRKGKTVAVLGCGVDVIYPKSHVSLYQDIVKEGVVLSEMAPGTHPHPRLFPQRNRIISGLSRGTVVIEAAARSGSLITANISMEQGREVFSVPGPIFSKVSEGTNQLIQEGAKCVICAKDILEEFSHVTHIHTCNG